MRFCFLMPLRKITKAGGNNMVRGEGGPLDKTLPMRLHVDTTTNAAQQLIFTAKKKKKMCGSFSTPVVNTHLE